MPDVFISYARANRELAESIRHGLEERGIECWIDVRDVGAGALYAAAIIEAIGQASAMIVIVSEHANSSAHLHREVERAVSRKLAILPVRAAAVDLSPELEYFLSPHQRIDAFAMSIDALIDELAANLRRVLGRGQQSDARLPEPPASTPTPARGATRAAGAGHRSRWLLVGAAASTVLAIAVALGVGMRRAGPGEKVTEPSSRTAAESKVGVFESFDDRRRAGAARPNDPRDSGTTAGAPADHMVGITLWRVRSADGAAQEGARLLRHPGDTAERVPLGTPLEAGTRVRLSIEAPEGGYLYVIDRERFSDGSLGPPHLIFPSARIRGGRNDLTGRVIEIPDARDDPPYFVLERSRPDHVGEELSVIVAPERLAALDGAASGAGELPRSIVDEGLHAWSQRTVRTDQEGGLGSLYSPREKDAAESDERALVHGDPLPQTVFEAPRVRGKPLAIPLTLEIARAP